MTDDYLSALRQLDEALDAFLDTGSQSGIGDDCHCPPDRELVCEGGIVHNAIKAVQRHFKNDRLPSPYPLNYWVKICWARDSEPDEIKWQIVAHENAWLLSGWIEIELEGSGCDLQAAVIKLQGQGKPVAVNGKEKRKLTTAQYNVISALLEASDGLNKDELVVKSGHTDAVKILKRVSEIDSDWKAVVSLAGKPGGRYRIVNPH